MGAFKVWGPLKRESLSIDEWRMLRFKVGVDTLVTLVTVVNQTQERKTKQKKDVFSLSLKGSIHVGQAK